MLRNGVLIPKNVHKITKVMAIPMKKVSENHVNFADNGSNNGGKVENDLC